MINFDLKFLSVGILSFNVPHCVITLNTEINVIDINSVLKVRWYKYNGSDTIQLTSNEISATSYVEKHFVSELDATKELPLGQYKCVAWVGQEMYKNVSAKAVASFKG